MENKRFGSGKYQSCTYLEVWEKNPDYLYWMAENYPDYWKKVLNYFELKDLKLSIQKKKFKKYPPTSLVREIFKLNPVCGFDMSDYICEIYELTPAIDKRDYFDSLCKRNNLIVNI